MGLATDTPSAAAPETRTEVSAPARRGIVANAALTLGRRALGWLGIGIGASIGLAFVELGISLVLQLFLKTLGLLAADVKTPALLGELTPARFAAFLVVLALGRSVCMFFMGQSANVSMEMITARLRRIAVWEALLEPSKRFVPAAQVNARIGDLANKSALFAYAGGTLAGALVQCTALVVIMFFVAPVETLAALVGLAVVGLMVLRINRVTRRVASHVPVELRVLTEGIERVARNITLVRVLRTETVEHRRLSTSIDTYARHLIRAAFLGNFAAGVPPFAGILLLIGIVALSQGVVHTPNLTLLSFLYLFIRFVQTLGGAVHGYSTCNTNWPPFKDSVDYVARFGKDEVESAMKVDEALVGRSFERTASHGGEAPAITIENVSFAYPGGEKEVLHDLSLEVDKGSQLAIVGPSGCGKSTLLAIILGLFEPTRGRVTLGGKSPVEYFAAPDTRVGYVGAESFLIAGTIRENLRYGLATTAEDDDLWRALEQAELKAAVESLPGRLDYEIAEDGSGMSAGQKQRLCLARALLGRPQLLVLDEVSANLDADTERAIAESLRHLHGSCTMILVSHRKGIVQYADRVLALGGATEPT